MSRNSVWMRLLLPLAVALVFVFVSAQIAAGAATPSSGSGGASPSSSNAKCREAKKEIHEEYNDKQNPKPGKYDKLIQSTGEVVKMTNLYGTACDYDIAKIKSASGVAEVKAACVAAGVCKCKSYLDNKGKTQSCDGDGLIPKKPAGPTTDKAPAQKSKTKNETTTPKAKSDGVTPKAKDDAGTSALKDALRAPDKKSGADEKISKTADAKDPSGTNAPDKKDGASGSDPKKIAGGQLSKLTGERPAEPKTSSAQSSLTGQKSGANTFSKPESATRGGSQSGARTILASFYGRGEKKGVILKRTANGKIFNPNAMTFALPLPAPYGSKQKVSPPSGTYEFCLGSRCAIAEATDYGNFGHRPDGGANKYWKREADLSYGLANYLSGGSPGLLRVTMRRIR